MRGIRRKAGKFALPHPNPSPTRGEGLPAVSIAVKAL
ncbi:hypothetical protein [Azospirillum doebereinerae]